jgi:hypothetical protein
MRGGKLRQPELQKTRASTLENMAFDINVLLTCSGVRFVTVNGSKAADPQIRAAARINLVMIARMIRSLALVDSWE